MNPQQFQAVLTQTLADRKLARTERQDLAKRIGDAALDDRQRGVYRHAAFDVARQALAAPANAGNPQAAAEILDWLEEVNKLLLPPTGDDCELSAEAFFSPGEYCVRRIIALLNGTRRSADVCVFTITDDRIASAILAAHKSGRAIRVVADNEKAEDLGSDILRLRQAGVPVRVDRTPYHMHHKFAIFDGGLLLTGSYNWTRSAAEQNEENMIVSNDRRLVAAFAREFERLWGCCV